MRYLLRRMTTGQLTTPKVIGISYDPHLAEIKIMLWSWGITIDISRHQPETIHNQPHGTLQHNLDHPRPE